MKTIVANLPAILLSPPEISKESQLRNWFSLTHADPVTDLLTDILWDREVAPESWAAARLSSAAYIYREKGTDWKVVAKFHAVKTGKDAIHHAERELRQTQQAWKYLGCDQEIRSVKPLGSWDGALFLEFVEGLTLEDKISVRRSQPGELNLTIKVVGKLLSKLHMIDIQPKATPDFGQAADYAHRLIDNLAKYGVLQNHPIVQTELGYFVEKWATNPMMWDYEQVQNHGDATTSNFIFPSDGGVVAIDWERSEIGDQAADLGRLMAEITHSVNQHGGNFAEGLAFANDLAAAYCNQLSSNWNAESLMYRARFYQATSTLRIARNGWLSLLDRLALVLHAFALLSNYIDQPYRPT
ncbi:MAG: phosphotransferase [Anaerolineae bacterium]|nr:phosphotransferase [Anaerolineae bacterium]